jgi:winged helix DNA-binding protein
MNNAGIRALRLTNQRLVGDPLPDATSVVRHFGAMQAQDYHGAKWAIGQRCGASDRTIEQLFNDGHILRTHLCRPTWHFVLPEDIRWLLQLTGPRVQRQNGTMYRKLGLDERKCTKAAELIARRLGTGPTTRDVIMADLRKARFDVTENRPAHYLMFAELEGIICSGPRVGKQFTYALLDHCVPPQPPVDRDDALERLARRYLASRGPASAHDLSLWSGLTVSDARKAIGMIERELERVEVNGQHQWYAKGAKPAKIQANTVHLLPNYDEYGIGYKDRSAFYDTTVARLSGHRGDPVFRHLILVNGSMIGTWDRTLTSKTVDVRTSTFDRLPSTTSKALEKAIKRYSVFLGLKRTG